MDDRPGASPLDGPEDGMGALEAGHSSRWASRDREFLTLDDVLPWWREAVERRGSPGHPPNVRVYAHFPYCANACRYCMYWRRKPRGPGDLDAWAGYLEALLARYRDALGPLQVNAAYLGGGTPSLLPARLLERVLGAFRDLFDVRHEFTCEANPDSLDAAKIGLLASAGVNRLSLGVQSRDPAVQAAIGRRLPADARIGALVREAQARGLFVSIDLLAGLPAQTLASARRDVAAVAGWGPDSICIYRYQPLVALPAGPLHGVALGRLLDRRTRAALAAGGYPEGDASSTFGLALTRPAAERWPAGDDALGEALLTHSHRYRLFDDPRCQLLGLGPGSWSHVFGRGWVREVTSLDAGVREGRTWYLGSRMTWMYAGTWPDAALLEVLDEGVRRGALEAELGAYRARRDADRGALDDLARRIVAGAGATGRTAGRREPPPGEVEPGLVGERSEGPDGEAAAAWARSVGVASEGGAWRGVAFRRVSPTEWAFQVRPAPEPALTVFVLADGPGFVRSGACTLGYRERPGCPLDRREEALLRALGAAGVS